MGYDRVIGQVLRYMAWVKREMAGKNAAVRGFIVASDVTEDLKLCDVTDLQCFSISL